MNGTVSLVNNPLSFLVAAILIVWLTVRWSETLLQNIYMQVKLLLQHKVTLFEQQ